VASGAPYRIDFVKTRRISAAACAVGLQGLVPIAGAQAVVSPVVVFSPGPPSGAGVSIDKAPGAISVVSASDLTRNGPPSLTEALGRGLASVTLGDTLDDPLQPDLLYRGFTASPVLGTPQGLAVYQNGVRINEAFGDAVNWDLIPDQAIRRVTVAGSNPVYGLNALGGAVAVEMKTGLSDPGGELDLSGGDFGRREVSGQYSARSGDLAVYVAGRLFREEGWRRLSSDLARQVYLDLSARPGPFSLDLTFTGADNRLNGQSAAPVQELAVGRSLVFTGPQSIGDRLTFVTLGAGWRASSELSVQAGAYLRRFRQAVSDGNTTSAQPCAPSSEAGDLCRPDGSTPLMTASGVVIPDLSLGGAQPIGQLNRQDIATLGYGGSVRVTSTAPLFGRANSATLGGEVDRADTEFASSSEIGIVDAALQVRASGFRVDTPEGGDATATPVALRAAVEQAGIWFADTLEIGRRVSVSVSGRWNRQADALVDRRGTALTGSAAWARFNPAAGLSWRMSGGLTAYAGYAEANRAPTPSEIECADPAHPCLLPSSLASDPPTLKQVAARTWEAGLRGSARDVVGGRLTWRAGVFRADLSNDIQAVSTSLGTGYFRNVGATRRQGVELSGEYRRGPLRLYAGYSFVDASYRTPFTEASPSNPAADAHGDTLVRAGSRLPGTPRHRFKAGVDGDLGRGVNLGGDVTMVSSQVYRGDEANALPPLPGYTVVGIRASWRWRPSVLVYVSARNVLDARFATFGVLGDPTGVGAPGVPASGADPRFQSPSAPRSVVGGVKLNF
jgi:iron complex outermembrane receptor protein